MPQGDTQTPSHTIEVDFPVHGDAIPLDHGYALYAALSRLASVGPWLHGTDAVAIHPIRGNYAGKGLLKLSAKSRLRLRLPAACLPQILILAGKRVEIDGHPVRIGVPQTTLLRPTTALYAHMVTTRNGRVVSRVPGSSSGRICCGRCCGPSPRRGKSTNAGPKRSTLPSRPSSGLSCARPAGSRGREGQSRTPSRRAPSSSARRTKTPNGWCFRDWSSRTCCSTSGPWSRRSSCPDPSISRTNAGRTRAICSRSQKWPIWSPSSQRSGIIGRVWTRGSKARVSDPPPVSSMSPKRRAWNSSSGSLSKESSKKIWRANS